MQGEKLCIFFFSLLICKSKSPSLAIFSLSNSFGVCLLIPLTYGRYPKKDELLVVPCDAFGIEGFVRIAYCVAKSTVENSLPAFEKVIK